ncbi:MAG: hypothetical protein IJ042_01090 [Butyricicoccus sp.]|nr:hypothetical protein [Butyricicoccus sp.]
MKKIYNAQFVFAICTVFCSSTSFIGSFLALCFARYPNLQIAQSATRTFFYGSILWFALCCLILIADASISKFKPSYRPFSDRLKQYTLAASMLGMIGWGINFFIMIA